MSGAGGVSLASRVLAELASGVGFLPTPSYMKMSERISADIGVGEHDLCGDGRNVYAR